MDSLNIKTANLHGNSVRYASAGKGPVLLLIHGMGGCLENWTEVIGPLSEKHTVIAPDLPGHGFSSTNNGDYSIGALASGLRDLLLSLGHEKATLVGHSLGGGIAMQFTYQFPEMVERLVLVSSGGLGPEVSLVLRAAALPGASFFIKTTASLAQKTGDWLSGALKAIDYTPSAHVNEVARGYVSLADPERRQAFLSTLRAVVGINGQFVSAYDRLYLTSALPVLIIWGQEDSVIPVAHAEAAHQALPGSSLEVLHGVGHLPQLEDPKRFTAVLNHFLAENGPAKFDLKAWRALAGSAN